MVSYIQGSAAQPRDGEKASNSSAVLPRVRTKQAEG